MRFAFLYAMPGFAPIGAVLVAMLRFRTYKRLNLPWAFSSISIVMLFLTGLDCPVQYLLLPAHRGLSIPDLEDRAQRGIERASRRPSSPGLSAGDNGPRSIVKSPSIVQP